MLAILKPDSTKNYNEHVTLGFFQVETMQFFFSYFDFFSTLQSEFKFGLYSAKKLLFT